MLIDRRTLLAGAGAVIASGLGEGAAATLATTDACLLAPAMRGDGSFGVMIFSEHGSLVREVDLPARGHDLAVHMPSGRAVAFARRPGTFAVGFDTQRVSEPRVFVAPADRHFFGHGAFSDDGKLLFATENNFDASAGVIGIYDATDAYRRIGEFRCHGVGTHEAILLPDNRTLAIANGGIETHPDFGRQMLNVPTMDPSLAFVDITTGDLIVQHRLPARHHQLSIRHMALGSNGAIWFGMQWEGDPLETPSLVGRASLDGGLELVATPEPELNAMRRYVGAMAASRDGTVISASAPRGGLIAYWSAETGKMLGTTAIEDTSGVAGFGAKSFLAANGAGKVIEAGPDTSRGMADMPGIAFDNHVRTLAT